MTPRLSPDLDPRAYAQTFQRQGWVQIPDILPADIADGVAKVLEDQVAWAIMCTDKDGDTHIIDREEYDRLGADNVRGYLQQMMRRAADGFAFTHLAYSLLDEYPRAKDHPIARMTEFLNGPEFLAFGAEVIGAPSVRSASAMASLYRPGDFLTWHDDSHTTDTRRAAFTLGLTRRWRPDWGGQLLFHDAAGDIEHGLAPGFNVLTLFKVPKAHSVAVVAPYAPVPRISITGWLRDDPSLIPGLGR